MDGGKDSVTVASENVAESLKGHSEGAGNDGVLVAKEVDEEVVVENVETTKGESNEEGSAHHGSVSIFRLFAYADAVDYLLMLAGFVGAAAHGCALPVFFIFFGKLLNGFGANVDNPRKAADVVGEYALYFLYLGLVVCFASWAEVAAWMQTGERQAARIRVRYLQAMLKQEVAYFDTDARYGDIVTSISSDTLLIQDAISEKFGNFIHYIVTFIAGFAVGFSLIWKLSLVTLAVVPAIALAGGTYAYSLTNLTSKSREAYAEAGGIAEQNIAQVRTVYSFVGEQKATESYSGALHRSLKLGYQSGLAKGLGMGITYSVLFCCWGLLLWYGGVLVRNGDANGGEALSTIFAVIVGGISLGQAMPNLTAFAKAKSVAYPIFKMINLKQQVEADGETAVLSSVQGHIEFRNVKFSYPSRPDVVIFQSLSIDIPASKTVAIVGGSGSGKSTVVSLIERFYDPCGGEVLLDGTNIRSLNRKWLRSQIGLVNQEPALFATSIRENILYGKEDASDKEIEEACRAANAHTFIAALPQGYHTQVGERGVQMSGGQKQRIAIARAILKNPAILLLDEATSALDASSERIVQAALDSVMVGRTTVIVAHRLSTIQNADAIAVVQEGAIVEMGDHATLLERDGAYSSLVRLQEMAQTKDGAKATLSRGNSVGERSQRLSMSKSGRRLSRQQSAFSEGVSDGSAVDARVEAAHPSSSKMWQLLKLNRPEWGYGALGCVGSALAGVMNPVFALIISNCLYSYYNTDYDEMERDVFRYAMVFVGLAGASIITYFTQHFFFGIMSENLIKRVREMMFAHILRNEISWFDKDENSSGQISARLSADATTVKGAIGDRISLVVQNFTLLVVAFVISFVLQWKLAFVVLATFPLMVFSAIVEQMFLKGFSGNVAGAQARASQVASEAVGNVRTVAAFNAEEKVVSLFQRELQAPLKRGFLRGQIAGIMFGVSQLCLFGSFGLGLWYGAQLTKRGEAKFGDVIKVFMVLLVSSFAVAETLALTPDIMRGGQALDSVFSVLDRRTEIDADDARAEVVDAISGDIEFKHVAFSYPNRPDVVIFQDLNLKVQAGKSLALVGASGSGKSSVISLLERFYDPTSGRVLIDNKDIRKQNLKSLRRRIALVSQEPALFATTIYGNILYGRETATEQEVHAAAMAANAHNFISALPESYNTQVGERGVQLSGGQKQRVAIARAVLKDPAILLLDEATSALDAESEKIVQEALDRLMQGRTSVIVAHRLSTIRNANSIAVIQDGTILEEGTHNELVARPNGAYAGLVSLQQQRH